MRRRAQIGYESAMTLVEAGHGDAQIERMTGIPRATVSGWRYGRGLAYRRLARGEADLETHRPSRVLLPAWHLPGRRMHRRASDRRRVARRRPGRKLPGDRPRGGGCDVSGSTRDHCQSLPSNGWKRNCAQDEPPGLALRFPPARRRAKASPFDSPGDLAACVDGEASGAAASRAHPLGWVPGPQPVQDEAPERSGR